MFDLRILENEGLLVSRSDGKHLFRGTIAVVIGDNLGSHAIGGFLQSFNSYRVCRFCMITKVVVVRVVVPCVQFCKVSFSWCLSW